EYDWTAASHDQAEDRAHRLGQKNAVTAWYLHATGTIDDAMAAIVEKKRAIAAEVGAGVESAQQQDQQQQDLLKIVESVLSRSQQRDAEKEKEPAREPARKRKADVDLEL
ncbi:MAG: hypothetical protein N2690_12365, partial [Rhodocyclaceae bacterium]|nr:hypothetical protein [Rhodocyclaceae bacterium]